MWRSGTASPRAWTTSGPTATCAAGLTSSPSGWPSEAPDFRYANLAIRGRLFDRIVDEQVPQALRMRPDLVSFAGGGNDVLRRNFDPAAMLARFDDVVRELRATGVRCRHLPVGQRDRAGCRAGG